MAVALAKMAKAIQLFRVMASSPFLWVLHDAKTNRGPLGPGITRKTSFFGMTRSPFRATFGAHALTKFVITRGCLHRRVRRRRRNGGLRPHSRRSQRHHTR